MWPFSKIKKLQMKIDTLEDGNDLLRSHITALEARNRVLMDIASLKDSESKLYRELLEEIGAQIDTHPDMRPVYEKRDDDFVAFEPVKITHVRLNKVFMGSEEPIQKLRNIDELLEKMHREKENRND